MAGYRHSRIVECRFINNIMKHFVKYLKTMKGCRRNKFGGRETLLWGAPARTLGTTSLTPFGHHICKIKMFFGGIGRGLAILFPPIVFLVTQLTLQLLHPALNRNIQNFPP